MHKEIAAAALALLPAACRKPESPDALRARAVKSALELQLASLRDLIGRAERGELVTQDQIAIGIEETVVKALLGAPLPREVVVGGRLRVRIESAEPYFRGNQAVLVFRARANSVAAPSAYASVELAGTLGEFAFAEGRLAARVKLIHFALLDSSVGPLAGLADDVIRSNLPTIEESIPPLELPVTLEQVVRIEGATMGPITVRPGELPLRIGVSQVVPINQRLWILLDASAGPWRALPAQASR